MAKRLQIFGVHVHVGHPLAGEGGRHRQRPGRLHPAPPGAVGVEPVLGGPRHRAGVVPQQGVRGPAHRRAARRRSRTGRTSSSSWRRSCPRRRSPRSARCGGTSARTPTSAPSSCACATASRRMSEVCAVAALAQCLVGWTSTRSIDRGYTLPAPPGLDAAPEQVAGRAPRPRRRAHRRRATAACSRCGRRSRTCSTSWRRWPAGSAATTSWPGRRHPRGGACYERQRAAAAGGRAARRPARRSSTCSSASCAPTCPGAAGVTGGDCARPRSTCRRPSRARRLPPRRCTAIPSRAGRSTAPPRRIAERLRAAGPRPAHRARRHRAWSATSAPAGPMVALRGDIDALRLDDVKDVPYRSKVPGCATPAATTCTPPPCSAPASPWPAAARSPARAGAAAVPAGRGGGARRRVGVVEAGSSTAPARSSPCTATPTSRSARSGSAPGPITSASDLVEIRLKGPGGHTARPHRTVDLVHVARQAGRRPARGAGQAERRPRRGEPHLRRRSTPATPPT